MSKLQSDFWLKYQKDWLKDDSLIKVAEKGRREGFTYVQSYEDVRDCTTKRYFRKNRPLKVWFTSADLSAAKEYIDYCKEWASFFNSVAKDLGEVMIDEDKDIKAYCLEFSNGAKIFALSSNPSQFRSKGGKVVIDEFAFHKNQKDLWKAAFASAKMWKYPIRVISTHNGQKSMFYQITQKIKDKKLDYSLHTVPVQKAVEQGLADKVEGRKLTKEERLAFLEELRKDAGDERTWKEEFCCIPVDEATAFLTYEMINGCKDRNVFVPYDELENLGDLYLGFDVARKKHLSVISVIEKIGNVRFLRYQIEMRNVTFREQKKALYSFLELKNLRRACIDKTGIGANLAEDAALDYGKSKVEGVLFTNASKEEMATLFHIAIEDKNIRIDENISQEVIEDWHSIEKTTTAAGNVRLDADDSDNRHADNFWSMSLANYAAASKKDFEKPFILSGNPFKNKGFEQQSKMRGLTGLLRRLRF
ncbi:MAG: terminase family protein [Candidatus Gastranaerophilales bacterium]|nr:terminase family protein [Candidatus Gastranaerophilales bacterium]